MKLGFDAKRAFLNESGLGNYSRNTLNALKKYYPDFQYFLFTPKIKAELFLNQNQFDIFSPNKSASKLRRTFWRTFSLSQQIQKQKLDIFHGLSNELPEGIHKTNVPSVVTIHDLIFMRFPKFYNTIDRKIYLQKVKYACNSANKIIAISKQTKDDIVNFIKINPDKIEVIHQSISSVFFENYTSEDLITKYSLPEKYILSVGSIEQRKNQLNLLKAIHSAKIKTPLIFVGKPTSYKNELIQFISENKMAEKVSFLTDVPERDLAGIYKMATLSVYISVFEGFGLPVIESMASGCPVITSNVSCLPETAGGAAVLCDPENIFEIGELIKIHLEDKKKRTELIQKGKERAQLFHPENYSKKLISLYSEILS